MQTIQRHFGHRHKTKKGAVKNFTFCDKMMETNNHDNVLILFKTRFVYFLVNRQKEVIAHSTKYELCLFLAHEKLGNPIEIWGLHK